MSLKIAAIAGLLNFLQIAVAAAPAQPAPGAQAAPVVEAAEAAATVTARTAIEVPHTRAVTAVVTGYSSTAWQTDSTPCIAASGVNICTTRVNAAASNDFPLGTKLKIPELGTFTVVDRMHARYSGNDTIEVDVYFRAVGGDIAAATQAARDLGRKEKIVFVL